MRCSARCRARVRRRACLYTFNVKIGANQGSDLRVRWSSAWCLRQKREQGGRRGSKPFVSEPSHLGLNMHIKLASVNHKTTPTRWKMPRIRLRVCTNAERRVSRGVAAVCAVPAKQISRDLVVFCAPQLILDDISPSPDKHKQHPPGYADPSSHD